MCSKCEKAFRRSDLLKRHERGHDRWDLKAGNDAKRSVKRRKVSFEDPASPDDAPVSLSSDARAAPASSPPLARYVDEVQPACLTPELAQPHSHTIRNFEPSEYTGSSIETPGSHFGSAIVFERAHHAGPTREAHKKHSEGFNGLEPSHTPTQQFGRLQPTHDSLFDQSDFTSFLLLPETDVPLANEWFSNDFYSAMRETGNDWGGGSGELLDPNFLSPGQDDNSELVHVSDVGSDIEEVRDEVSDGYAGPGQGRISRISSPPNEASEEDKWPFQWNPNSRPILSASPIFIADDHPLLLNHRARFDITEGTLLRLRAFLKAPAGRDSYQSEKGTFVLPSLRVINVFIGLFFEHFSPQMPVLHHATVNPNVDLPPPLLAAMIIIGAIYSHLKHTRRFSIVLLDILRWHLQIALECDNSLMREPMIIFAEALICHTGLWCGNKRAFELAEVVRGAAVTHIRRVHFAKQGNPAPESSGQGSVSAQWRAWIAEESQRRLYWVVYGLDGQFPSLLNLPATISIGEVSNLGCPCDEEFWCAASARNWKNLLGPATVPPSRSFSAAIGPFILSAGAETRTRLSIGGQMFLDLNPWSAFLVLLTIQNRIFQYSQESHLGRTFLGDEDQYEGEDDSYKFHPHADRMHSSDSAASVLRSRLLEKRQQLADLLSSWHRAYSGSRPSTTTYPTSLYFHTTSVVLYHLSTVLLSISLSDLQNAIGKDGTVGISQAMRTLSRWAHTSPQIAQGVAFNAAKTIIALTPAREIQRGSRDEGAPYSIITLFLCHVVLWVYASVSPEAERGQLMDVVEACEGLKGSSFFDCFRTAMAVDEHDRDGRGGYAPQVLFKSAAEMLTQLGTWGASLNLALLIHRRAEMQ